MTDSFQAYGRLVLLAFVAIGNPMASAAGAPSSDLARFLQKAVTQDAPINAARLRWEAARERVPAAGALPDPELAYGYFFSPVETRVGAQNQKFGLFQKIPWPERLREQAKLAEAGVLVAYYDYLATVRERVAAAKSAWIRRASVGAQIRIMERELELLEEALRTMDGGLASGRADLAARALLRQQVTRVESRRLALMGDAEAARAALRRFAGNTVDEIEPAPALAAIQPRPLPKRGELTRLLLEHSEPLQARSAAVREAERARAVARLQRRPDITVGVEYTEINDNIFADPVDNGEDAILGSIRISLPIWKGKYDALEAGARRELSAARARERATADDLTQRMRETYAKAEALERQLRLYEDKLLPQTRETFEAAVAAFGSGRGDALQWIEAQRDRLDAETGRVLLRTEYLQAIVVLERICAVALIEGTETPAPTPSIQ
ncbi:MAG: TolC family protein [Opitutales bacterium]